MLLEVEHLRTSLKVVAFVFAANRDGFVDIVVKDRVLGEIGLRLDQALLEQMLNLILVGFLTFFWVEAWRAEMRLYLDGVAFYDFFKVNISDVGSQCGGIEG